MSAIGPAELVDALADPLARDRIDDRDRRRDDEARRRSDGCRRAGGDLHDPVGEANAGIGDRVLLRKAPADQLHDLGTSANLA